MTWQGKLATFWDDAKQGWQAILNWCQHNLIISMLCATVLVIAIIMVARA